MFENKNKLDFLAASHKAEIDLCTLQIKYVLCISQCISCAVDHKNESQKRYGKMKNSIIKQGLIKNTLGAVTKQTHSQ